MNIFQNYLAQINKIILENKDFLNLDNIENLHDIILEIPPAHFNYDLSTNVCLVLAKANKTAPNKLALKIKNLLFDKINHFEKIDIAGPGFLNIKLSKQGVAENINEIIKNKENFGSKQTNETYNVEFVSANPTGPMHVGHCRGAIFGDVISNLLLFNGNKVVKEYYINDYGNQIKNFVESIYLRIREIKFKEKFIDKEHLYPGNYVREIAKNIISKNQNFSEFELHARAVLRIPVKEITLEKNGASAVVLANHTNKNTPTYSGINEAALYPNSDFRIFGKPSTRPYRRMAVALAFGNESVDNFGADAARIYISQLTNVDTNFGISEGKTGLLKARSAVAIKADGVRIVAREGIKLVTQTDVVNSQGGLSPINDIYGIDLIAMNDELNSLITDEMQ